MSERLERAREMLKTQLTEIEEEAGQLRAVLAKLDGGAVAKPQKRRRRSKGRRSGSKRVARGQRPKQFLAAAKANPKATVAEIAKEIGVSANQAGSLARRLEARGEIKRSKQGIRITAKANAQ